MSLEYTTLSNKQTFTKESDYEGNTQVEMYDLLTPVFSKELQQFGTPIIVSKEYIGRMDLISFSVYENERYGDILCKINDISNPFELNEGDIIYCPPIGILPQFFKVNSQDDLEGYSFPQSKNYNKNESIYTDNSTKYQKKVNDPTLQPNEQTIGESDYIIDRTNNLVFY